MPIRFDPIGRSRGLDATSLWLRVSVTLAVLALLAYGCADQSCRRTRTCPNDGVDMTTGSNLPDASLTEPSDAGGAMASGVSTCPAGQHLCTGVCVPSDDPLTCGASCTPCESPVDGAATCDGVRCGGSCAAGQALCAGTCIEAETICARDCPTGTHECSGLCPSDDSVNACGVSCDPCPVPENALQASCEDGTCSFVCMIGYHRCGDTCRRDTDVSACGPNCEPCTPVENGFPACNNRVCTVWCEPGFHVCGERCVRNDSPDSCGPSSCSPCTAPSGGSAACNAGECGAECPEGEKPCAGVCISQDAACSGLCPEGTHNCNEVCVPDDSAAQCGAECVSCPVPTGATTAVCIEGRCGIAACREPGFRRCGDSCPLIDSVDACGPECEACPEDASDPTALRSCQNDACGLICSDGFHLCEDGCHGNSDINACGANCAVCTAPDGGSVACVSGACVPSCPLGMKQCLGACIAETQSCDGACPGGTHDCNDFCVDDTSIATCGARCSPCPEPPDFGDAVCSSGVCNIACELGFHECSGECAPDDDPNRCGETCEQCSVADLRTERATCQGGQCVAQCLGTQELCDAILLDEDCDGDVNEGCQCLPGTPGAVSTCAGVYSSANLQGVCATRTLSCTASGQWPAFETACVMQTAEVCDAGSLDEDCDGQANEGCVCTPSDTTSCEQQYPTSQGPCAERVLTCTAAGAWPAQQGNCTPALGTQDACDLAGDDSNCNGVPNDACTCVNPGGGTVANGASIPCGQCNGGTRSCVNGALTACTVATTTCAGCCSGTQCVSGTAPPTCGVGGELCSACAGLTPVCLSGDCVACNPAATPLPRRCAGDTPEVCNLSGTFVPQAACTGDTPECNPSSGTCICNDTSCDKFCDGATLSCRNPQAEAGFVGCEYVEPEGSEITVPLLPGLTLPAEAHVARLCGLGEQCCRTSTGPNFCMSAAGVFCDRTIGPTWRCDDHSDCTALSGGVCCYSPGPIGQLSSCMTATDCSAINGRSFACDPDNPDSCPLGATCSGLAVSDGVFGICL